MSLKFRITEDMKSALRARESQKLGAIRIACREAQVRSKHPIDRVSAEFVVRPDPRGIRVDIDVEARVLARAARGKSEPPRSSRAATKRRRALRA
jgi:hypothetical protein